MKHYSLVFKQIESLLVVAIMEIFYCGNNNSKTIDSIVSQQVKIKEFVRVGDDNFLIGAQEMYKIRYIYECLSGERNIPRYFGVEEVEEKLHIGVADVYGRKIHNMYQAMNRYFPNIYCVDPVVTDLNTDYITQLHKVIMDGLMEKPGTFRLREAYPYLEPHFTYSPSRCIKHELEKLCESTALRIATSGCFADRLKETARFLADFLRIHPFSNGNGRVARVLLSLLLCDGQTIPIFIYNSKFKRDLYLECLQEHRFNAQSIMLHQLLLDSVKDSHQFLSYMLEL